MAPHVLGSHAPLWLLRWRLPALLPGVDELGGLCPRHARGLGVEHLALLDKHLGADLHRGEWCSRATG